MKRIQNQNKHLYKVQNIPHPKIARKQYVSIKIKMLVSSSLKWKKEKEESIWVYSNIGFRNAHWMSFYEKIN